MNEIEVGEYVRTKDGRIEKVKVINKYGIVHKHDNDNDTFDVGINWYAESGREINEEDIKAHSKNILDIVEVGDYINGDIVNQITKNYISVGYITIGKRNIKNIRKILTHEQYEQYSYKVGDIE